MNRYSRQIIIPEISLDGQQKLLNAKVLVVGAGGLGCPALLYLVAAGIGHISIIDFDDVDISNLQRQILFTENDVGKSKVECAAARLEALNKDIKIEKIKMAITVENVLGVIDGHDVVIDTSDNFLTRYVVNDACFMRGIPLIHGSMFRFEGQVSVFNLNKDAPCYRCLYPEPPPNNMIPNCSAGGAVGGLAGVIGSLQAVECIKIIIQQGEILSGKLLNLNLLDLDFVSLEINKSILCKLCSQVEIKNNLNPEWYNFSSSDNFCPQVKSISEKELLSVLRDKTTLIKLIDVREKWELNEFENEINCISIPLSTIEKSPHVIVGEISHLGKNVFCCEDGSRSERVISLIENELGYTNLYSFKGNLNRLFSNEREIR